MGKKKKNSSKASVGTGAQDMHTEGLDDVLRENDESDAKKTRRAVDEALATARAGQDKYPPQLQLFKALKL